LKKQKIIEETHYYDEFDKEWKKYSFFNRVKNFCKKVCKFIFIPVKFIIKNWLGISKIEAEIYNLNNDVIGLMDKQLDEVIKKRIIRLEKGKK